jgi:hypothetical protein
VHFHESEKKTGYMRFGVTYILRTFLWSRETTNAKIACDFFMNLCEISANPVVPKNKTEKQCQKYEHNNPHNPNALAEASL